MKPVFDLNAAKWMMMVGVLCFVVTSRAVDPPPPEVLQAPVSEQLKYLDKVGRESARARAKVAKERFEEKQQYREAVAAQMDQELTEQRAIMIAQSMPSDESGARSAVSAESGPSAKAWAFVLFAAFIFTVYRYRDRLFQRFQKNS